MWIEKKARDEYNDCPAHGLRLHFDSSVNAYERKECVRFFTIAHELTHYFQWFFYEDMHRTNRSLEIEATRWAKYLLQQYLNTPSSCCKSC